MQRVDIFPSLYRHIFTGSSAHSFFAPLPSVVGNVDRTVDNVSHSFSRTLRLLFRTIYFLFSETDAQLFIPPEIFYARDQRTEKQLANENISSTML